MANVLKIIALIIFLLILWINHKEQAYFLAFQNSNKLSSIDRNLEDGQICERSQEYTFIEWKRKNVLSDKELWFCKKEIFIPMYGNNYSNRVIEGSCETCEKVIIKDKLIKIEGWETIGKLEYSQFKITPMNSFAQGKDFEIEFKINDEYYILSGVIWTPGKEGIIDSIMDTICGNTEECNNNYNNDAISDYKFIKDNNTIYVIPKNISWKMTKIIFRIDWAINPESDSVSTNYIQNLF